MIKYTKMLRGNNVYKYDMKEKNSLIAIKKKILFMVIHKVT